jgi:hypothetical protein
MESDSNPSTAPGPAAKALGQSYNILQCTCLNFKKESQFQDFQFFFKGIVSQDFEVCFFIPVDSSDIATPDGTG